VHRRSVSLTVHHQLTRAGRACTCGKTPLSRAQACGEPQDGEEDEDLGEVSIAFGAWSMHTPPERYRSRRRIAATLTKPQTPPATPANSPRHTRRNVMLPHSLMILCSRFR